MDHTSSRSEAGSSEVAFSRIGDHTIIWQFKLFLAFDVLILLLVFAVPACYLSMSTSYSTPPFFSRRLLDQHLMDLLHQWFFLRLPCIRESQSLKGIRKPSIEQPALAPRSSNNKEQPAAFSSSDQ